MGTKTYVIDVQSRSAFTNVRLSNKTENSKTIKEGKRKQRE